MRLKQFAYKSCAACFVFFFTGIIGLLYLQIHKFKLENVILHYTNTMMLYLWHDYKMVCIITAVFGLFTLVSGIIGIFLKK